MHHALIVHCPDGRSAGLKGIPCPSPPGTSRQAEETKTLINDFSIEVATVNGSGSQTANNVLLRAIFQMGIPVSGKNLFPSNIAGLPTWFQIRANARGYVARKHDIDLMICMNPETAKDDVAEAACRRHGPLRRAPAARRPARRSRPSTPCPSSSS